MPWDLATREGRPPEAGAWGRRSPPGDLEEWARVIRQFAADLAAYLGPGAAAIQFETGVEYDERASFDGTAPEFFQYYETTDRALHSVLPDAGLTPGEFTALGICTPNMTNCVYDTRDFLELAAQDHLTIADVAAKLGKPQSFVSNYESGERRLDLLELQMVCEVLGVGLVDFTKRYEAASKR